MPTSEVTSDGYDFSIYWIKNGKQIDYKKSERNFFSQPEYPDHPTIYGNNWIFNQDSNKKLFRLEHFRQEFPVNEDLSEYTLGISFDQKAGLPKQKSWLALGRNFMEASKTIYNSRTNEYKVEFDLKELRSALVGTADQGVRQFTFIPYTEENTDPKNIQYFGKRVVSITTGPSDYSYKIPQGYVQATKYTSEIKNTKALKNLRNESILPGFTISVGGIADLLLNKGYVNQGGFPENVQQYILNVNGKVDTSEQLLSQAILVKYEGKDQRYKTAFPDARIIMLQNDIPWYIIGSKDGIVDSKTKMLQGTYEDSSFWNKALNLQSSHTGSYAITVTGVTFKDNAKNGDSAIQLNGFNSTSYDWWVPPDPNKHDEIYWERIKTAIDNYAKPNGIGIKVSEINNGIERSPVHMYDNQIFTWADASDGPETLQANSLFQKNVQMTADDNIKVLSNNSTWDQMTLIQGNTGSSISLGSYGLTNGSVTGNNITNIYVPRIAQYKSFDYINGVISNKTVFNKRMDTLGNFGIYNNFVGTKGNDPTSPEWDGVYVASWDKGTGEGDINKIRDIGVLSALNFNNTFNDIPPLAGNLTTNQHYALGANHFRFSVANESFVNGPKQLLYAFGDNKSVSNVAYSGSQWNVNNGGGQSNLSIESNNSFNIGQTFDITIKRIDQEPGLVNFGVYDGISKNQLLSSAVGRLSNIAVLTHRDLHSDNTSINWLSTEGNMIGSFTAKQLKNGSYQPYAFLDGEMLGIKDIQQVGNSIDVHFDKNVKARFSSQSPVAWPTNLPQTSSIYLNIQRLGRLETSLGFYECDPISGAIMYKDSKFMPGDDGYLTNALELSKEDNLFFGTDRMPDYQEELTISDITNFNLNGNYALLLSVGGMNPVIHSSISRANPGNAIQMISTATTLGTTKYAFEDIPVSDSNSDQDFNDLIVTIGATATIPYVRHSDNPQGFIIDYEYNGNTYPNLIDLYANTVFPDFRHQ